MKVSCDPALLPARSLEELQKYTGTASPDAPGNDHTWAYEQLVNGNGAGDDECGELDLLPHNEVCAPQLSQHLASEMEHTLDLHRGLGDGLVPDKSLDMPSDRQPAFINVRDLPSFYLHDNDPFNFTDSVHCLLNATGLRADVDNFDEQLLPDMAEHMVDWWLLKRFERHPARVFDPNTAQLHVIGSPFSAAYRAHSGMAAYQAKMSIPEGQDDSLGCGDLDSFYRRTAAIARYLKATSWWKQHGGKNFLMLNSFYHVSGILGAELLSTLVSGPAIFTSSDRNYIDFNKINGTVTPTIVPYKAHYRLDDFAWLQVGAQPRERTNSVMFHGSTGRGGRDRPNPYAEGELRQLICDRLGPTFASHALRCVQNEWKQALEEQTSDLRARSIGQDFETDGRISLRKTGNNKLADSLTNEAYTNSKLCLIPAGDTPTSRRLFDSMAAGCLPVLLTPVEDIMPNLPFPTAINWPQTVLFGGGLGCSLRDNPDETISWLQSLLTPENEQTLQCMGRRAQKVFLKYLTLRDEGVVSALLHEIDLTRVQGAATAPNAGGSREQERSDTYWLLEVAAPGVQLQCSAGRRGATEEECLAAVREAASRDGLEVAGFKSVNDGAAGVVPAGCSYSVHTKTAMFNTNAAGGYGAGNYQLACRASV